jgi:intergrase/recombinase
LTKAESPGEIFEWINKVKDARPELSDFLEFMAVTGLRMIEAVESYNLIIELAHQRKIKDYYKAEKQTLEHFKFKETFLRKSKKAFISFVPWALIQKVSQQTPVSLDMIRKRVQKKGLPLRFSDIREAHGTLLTKYLKDAEVDFLEGRVANSVFMRNYFNPALIVDLEARAFQGIQEIQEKVKA